MQDDNLHEYECSHCGSVDDVRAVDFTGTIRHLCAVCVRKILAWI